MNNTIVQLIKIVEYRVTLKFIWGQLGTCRLCLLCLLNQFKHGSSHILSAVIYDDRDVIGQTVP